MISSEALTLLDACRVQREASSVDPWWEIRHADGVRWLPAPRQCFDHPNLGHLCDVMGARRWRKRAEAEAVLAWWYAWARRLEA